MPLIVWAMLLPLAVHLVFGIPRAFNDAALETADLSTPQAPGLATQALGVALFTMLAALVQAVVTTLGGTVLHGFVANNVRLETLGHRASARELWSHTRPALGRLLAFGGIVLGFTVALSIVAGFIVFIAAFVIGGIVAIFSSSPAAIVSSVVVVTVAVLVPVLWLSSRLSLAPSAIVFEGATATSSLRRSWDLTRTLAWRLVGLQLVMSLAAFVVAGILTLLFGAIADAAFPLAAWESGITTQRVLAAYLTGLPISLSAAAIAPVIATIFSTVYLDARTRVDWLAASLQHFHDGRAQGYVPAQLADPFIAPAPAQPMGQPDTTHLPPASPQWAPPPEDPRGPHQE